MLTDDPAAPTMIACIPSRQWLPRSWLGVVMAAFLLLGWTASAIAEERFEIRSAYVEAVGGVYLLNARLHFELPQGAQSAIHDGVALKLDVEIVVSRARRFWFDASVASLVQSYELAYHALSERYVVRNLNSGEQSSHATLADALDALSTIRDLPVIDESLITPDQRYEVSTRAILDVRNVPKALRVVLFWLDEWQQASDWYTWPLKL